jgi:hypothetical protein
MEDFLNSISTVMLYFALSSDASAEDATVPPPPSQTIQQITKMSDRFVPTPMKVNLSTLSKNDEQALAKLIEAARVMDAIFLKQAWSGNLAKLQELHADPTPLGEARLHYFWLNKGPWSEIDNQMPFLPGVPPRPDGANFYPEDMKKIEFEAWLVSLPADQQETAKGFFSIIHRTSKSLELIPYSKAYAAELTKAAALLREAAALTENASLKKFLELRAQAFLNDDYYASDVAWMDLDAPLEVTIGPYETYNDKIFGYKAAFEAFINIRDEVETNKLGFFAGKLQEVENHLPIDAKYRNPKIGALSPIRVVNQVIASGDAGHAIPTAAYNLPNDERVVKEKGSKRVMLKNIQEAKFKSVLVPIAGKLLSLEDEKYLDFNSFFTHILAHELSHGIGPHQIMLNGKSTSPRAELKELYSAIEESKADITSLFMLQYLFDHAKNKNLKGGKENERKLYTTYLASSFRTLRFGLGEAHGKGMALQLNYLLDKKAFEITSDGKFKVNFSKVKAGVKDLTHDLLTLEATGDYAGAKKLLDQLGVLRPEIQKALAQLDGIPTDIHPIHVTADELSPPKAMSFK